jgi:hypothetical protein
MLLVFDSTSRCKQLLSVLNVKSRTRTRLTDEHLEGCMRVATAGIEPGIERLLRQMCRQMSHQ